MITSFEQVDQMADTLPDIPKEAFLTMALTLILSRSGEQKIRYRHLLLCNGEPLQTPDKAA